jgi:hypothetical protein
MDHDKNHNGARRRASVLIVTVGIALLAAACGGGSSGSAAGGSSTTGRSTQYEQALAYAQCMRAHGVPNFPDPNSKGQFIQAGQGSGPGVTISQAQPALNACRHLAPNGGQISQAQRAQAASQSLKFTRCMRSQGVPNMPDPSSNGGIDLRGTGIDPNSPQFQSAQRACRSVNPAPPGAGP